MRVCVRIYACMCAYAHKKKKIKLKDMILDSFTNKEYKRVRKAFEKVADRNRRATLAAMLCAAYDAFHKTQLYRICAVNDCTYAEAEKRSVEFSDAFGVDIPTDAFLPNADKYTNCAIDSYHEYEKYVETFINSGYLKEDVDSFCKMVFYSPQQYDMYHFRAFNSVGYMYAMIAVYDYLIEACSEEQMIMLLQIFEPSGMQPMTDVQIRYFLRTMIHIVDVFQDIVYLRETRHEKASY